MNKKLKEYREARELMNKHVHSASTKPLSGFVTLEKTTMSEGVLNVREKAMLALTASLVLKSDDSIRLSLERCVKHGVTPGQISEVFSIACLTGGSVVMPHVAKAMEYLELLQHEKQSVMAHYYL